MQEISREEYISRINPKKTDYVNLNLIITEEDKVFLRADIENEEDLRIEMMNFEMDTSLNFIDSNSESRNCEGKIYFIEYDSEEEAEENILKDFLNIEKDSIYLICKEEDLKNILPKYKNKIIYVMTDFEIKK